MMFYQLYQVERIKPIAELRAADARRGEFAAALLRSLRVTRQRARVLVGTRLPVDRADHRAISSAPLRTAG